MTIAVGFGYDSHRFEAGRPLILGGVEIPSERGLAGHSDADVLTHAITDAVLGAAGLGDIGTHFPDTDPAFEDAPSLDFLRTAIGMAGGTIVNIDATLICEEPRLGPHRAEIEGSITAVTGSRFNLKATTNEGMGWIGRGEGMACMAVVSMELP